jgi:adenosylcobinamide-phosphate synthase
MEWLEHRCYRDSRWRGAEYAAAGIGIAAGAGLLLGASARARRPAQTPSAGAAAPARPLAHTGRRIIPLALATYVAVAGRALGAAARQVAAALEAGDLDTARGRLPALVGRDTDGLEPSEIARAVVESVAENTVDAIVAPAMWAALAGPPGALAYRAVNTLDAMVGHRSPRYARFGWAAARADDAAGWLPARLTALLVAAVRPRAARHVAVAVRRQAPAHPSPNAGVAEAAFAGALGVRLGGRNVYLGRPEHRATLGSGPEPGASDIGRAVCLSRDVTVAGVAVGLLLSRPWRRA